MKQHIISRTQMIWFYALGLMVVIGGVMSFGLIAFIFGLLDTNTALSMVFMIIPMSAVMYGMIYYVTRHLENHLEPLLTGIHRVAGGDLSTQLDVTKAAEYEAVYEGFNSMVKELDATKKEMQNFTNEFTHEFKTPITSISGFADLLLEAGDELSAEERREYVKIIADQSKRLSHLSQNALLLSKVEAAEIITDKTKFSITDQIQKCAILLLKQIEEKQITLDLPEEEEIYFLGNEELMEQVWINLLGNAIKFTPEKGTITISEQVTDDEIRISIADTGEGMSTKTMAHIFEKYYQHDTTNMVKGNGIGLSIVKRITELSGGSVAVESTLGKGSTFTVCLPENIK